MKKQILSLLFALISYSVFSTNVLQTDTTHRNISVAQADSLIQANTGNPDFVILDVRTPSEVANGIIANSININFYDPNFSSLLDALDHNKLYLVHCQSGGRSAQAYNMMITKHFVEFYNMLGGMNAWVAAGYPVVTVTDLAEQENKNSVFSIFPNPLTNAGNIISSNNGTIEIYNSVGSKIESFPIESDSPIPLNANNLSAGIYIATFRNSSNEATFVRFLVP